MILFEIPFATIIEWLCLITAILIIKNKPNPKYWVWFIPFLVLTVGIETYSYFLAKTTSVSKDVQWIYNLFILVYVSFHIYIFSKIINIAAIKIIALIIAVLLVGIYIWEWNDVGFTVFFSITNTMFGGCVILFSLLYYYGLFKAENYISIPKSPEFWFATGCLVFYATTTSVNAFFKEIIDLGKAYNFPIRFVVLNFLNLFMYSCWIKSFLCLNENKMYSRQ